MTFKNVVYILLIRVLENATSKYFYRNTEVVWKKNYKNKDINAAQPVAFFKSNKY